MEQVLTIGRKIDLTLVGQEGENFPLRLKFCLYFFGRDPNELWLLDLLSSVHVGVVDH